LLIIILFILDGWRKGFGQYFLEILITAISLLVAWCYYRQSQEIFKSLFVFVWAFAGLRLLKWFLYRAWRKSVSQKPGLSSINRFGGAILGSIWGIFIVSVIIFTLDLLPTESVFKYDIKQEVRQSRSYQIVQRLIPANEISAIENISYISEIGIDEEAKLKLAEQPEFQEIIQHESFKAIMEDPELAKQLQNKDLPRLLTNPKIHNLLNDGQFIEKLMKLDFKKALE